MAEINTTSINDLPTDPANGGSIGGNITLVTNDPIQTMPSTQPTSTLSLDQSTISQIVNGLQQASLAGATQLPSRDIPIRTEQLTTDPNIQSSYIPPSSQKDYILDTDIDIHQYNPDPNKNTLDNVYDEIQGPLLLSVLYFLFQLPFFKKLICRYLPFLCHNDGNYNINGLFFTCALFGFIYYSLSKFVNQFSKF